MSEQRFEFGKNWKSFLFALNEDRIDEAIKSRQRMLGVDSLRGKRFLDLGCGSGLFSLAAHRMGAEVVSIDFDIHSVACTEELRSRAAMRPRLEYPRGFSVGRIADAIAGTGGCGLFVGRAASYRTDGPSDRVGITANQTGRSVCIAIYNDQGSASHRWLAIKRIYNRLPGISAAGMGSIDRGDL